jgi:hypothetical protein
MATSNELSFTELFGRYTNVAPCFNETALLCIPECCQLRAHRRENLKCHKL